MRIILNEIKKIFSLKMVSLLMLISIIMYFLFISFYIEYFPNGRPKLDIYNISVEMVDNYGEYMDEREFEDFKSRYDELVKETDRYIQSREEFIKADITTYEQFQNMDTDNKELDKFYKDIIFKRKIDIFWELPQRENFITLYENREEFRKDKPLNNQQERRIKELLKKGSRTSVLPYMVLENYNDLIKPVCSLILIGIIFIISPIYLRDSKNKVNYLQYTSKTGRKIFKKKIAAGLLSAFIITTIQLIYFFTIYSLNNVSMFYKCNINSIFNYRVYWYDLTFIQYIVLTVVAIYSLAFIVTLISMLVSSIGRNYITIIGIQLPIALLTFIVLLRYIIINMTDIRYSQLFLPLCYLILIFIGIIPMVIRWRKESVLDVTS